MSSFASHSAGKAQNDFSSSLPVEDRRVARRYPIQADLRYKVLRRGRVLESGEGCTVDLSSGGVLFHADRALPPGVAIELEVNWPAAASAPLAITLSIAGRTVRWSRNCTAVRIRRYAFRVSERWIDPRWLQ
ncbi:MAG TPA: hypothetical protein VGF59_13235 [Bryobacteraceae bacterium]|jgi:hypothetical protein